MGEPAASDEAEDSDRERKAEEKEKKEEPKEEQKPVPIVCLVVDISDVPKKKNLRVCSVAIGEGLDPINIVTSAMPKKMEKAQKKSKGEEEPVEDSEPEEPPPVEKEKKKKKDKDVPVAEPVEADD